MFVIRNIETGKCVAKSGHPNSYTLHYNYIRKFKTREEAERNACGNETVEEMR